MRKSFELRFLREEINHVVMTMPIKAEDVEHVRGLTVDGLYTFVVDKQQAVSYTPGTEATRFYEWHAGKEFCEGEGDRGMWDFTLGEYTQGSRVKESALGNNNPVAPNVDMTNEDRVRRAESAIFEYDEMRDLLSDLMHYCTHYELDFIEEMHTAKANYFSELPVLDDPVQHILYTGKKSDSCESYKRAECTCGWVGKWRSCMTNWQMHDVATDKRDHEKEANDAS